MLLSEIYGFRQIMVVVLDSIDKIVARLAIEKAVYRSRFEITVVRRCTPIFSAFLRFRRVRRPCTLLIIPTYLHSRVDAALICRLFTITWITCTRCSFFSLLSLITLIIDIVRSTDRNLSFFLASYSRCFFSARLRCNVVSCPSCINLRSPFVYSDLHFDCIDAFWELSSSFVTSLSSSFIKISYKCLKMSAA